MSDKTAEVFVSVDGGDTWKRHPEVPGSPEQAIRRVRETNPEYTANTDTLFYATGRFTPRKWAKQLVEKWGLEDVQLPPTERNR